MIICYTNVYLLLLLVWCYMSVFMSICTFNVMWVIAVMCEGGRQYSPCSSPCRRTCRNAALPMDSYCAAAPCVEGCYCPPDTVESGTNITASF